MRRCRWLLALFSLLSMSLVAWWSTSAPSEPAKGDWEAIAPGVFRTKTEPYGYALVDGEHALLIDAPVSAAGLHAHGVMTIDQVLLTHHHRDSIAEVGSFLAAKIPVRAAKAGAEWLTTANVRKFWQDAIPLRSSRTAYFVVPSGFEGIDCTLEDGQKIDWRGKIIEVLGTPGHSRDHLAFVIHLGKDPNPTIFCGDAVTGAGKIYTPYTTDWDHWTDAGLKPTHESLRKLAGRKPTTVYPAHGPAIAKNPVAVLETAAAAVEEVGFLRSFQRFTDRLGNPPQYKFLVPREQIASGGDKPWARVSDHLWITGNTYVLVSKTQKAHLVIDPWGKRSADQLVKLQKDQELGPLELVMFSHAHYDHYDGVYLLPDREKFKVWTLDRVAEPIATPFQLRAPFLDARPVRIDRTFKDGDTAMWREYQFRFYHFPGQSEFTMAVETTIDGKKCLFTADNFFHQEQFSGSGGWMGLNRSYPLPYAASAKKVLEVAPDWILAEHGGPYEYNAEDYRRRVKWGEESAKAADRICPSGNHRRDWDPHRVRMEPLLQTTKAGATIKGRLRLTNPSSLADKVTVQLQGRGVFDDQTWTLDVPPGRTVEQEVTIRLPAKLDAGRHVFILRSNDRIGPETVDGFMAIDVE